MTAKRVLAIPAPPIANPPADFKKTVANPSNQFIAKQVTVLQPQIICESIPNNAVRENIVVSGCGLQIIRENKKPEEMSQIFGFILTAPSGENFEHKKDDTKLYSTEWLMISSLVALQPSTPPLLVEIINNFRQKFPHIHFNLCFDRKDGPPSFYLYLETEDLKAWNFLKSLKQIKIINFESSVLKKHGQPDKYLIKITQVDPKNLNLSEAKEDFHDQIRTNLRACLPLLHEKMPTTKVLSEYDYTESARFPFPHARSEFLEKKEADAVINLFQNLELKAQRGNQRKCDLIILRKDHHFEFKNHPNNAYVIIDDEIYFLDEQKKLNFIRKSKTEIHELLGKIKIEPLKDNQIERVVLLNDDHLNQIRNSFFHFLIIDFSIKPEVREGRTHIKGDVRTLKLTETGKEQVILCGLTQNDVSGIDFSKLVKELNEMQNNLPLRNNLSANARPGGR